MMRFLKNFINDKEKRIVNTNERIVYLRTLFCRVYILVILVLIIFNAIFLYQFFQKNINLFKSWHSCNRIVVIESDDWGKHGLSKKILGDMLSTLSIDDFFVPLTYQNGLDLLRDAIESEDDLEKLYNVLERHKDSRGRNPIFTAYMIVANPDFNIIQKNEFQKYSVIEPDCNIIAKWSEGVKRGIFYPQYHGYAHFNYEWWLKQLINKDLLIRKLFYLNVVRIPKVSVEGVKLDFRAEYIDLSVSPSLSMSFEKQKEIIGKGLNIFEKLFGFKSLSTMAPFYYWDKDTEKAWSLFGVRYIQGGEGHSIGTNKNGKKIKTKHFIGERNDLGQLYSIRNCRFEPMGRQQYRWEDTFREVEDAFNHNLPAIIATHRYNYVSGVDRKMRDLDLAMLDMLLTQIKNRYPGIIYLTSVELGELISSGTFQDFITGKVVKLPIAWSSNINWLLKKKLIQSLLLLLILLLSGLFIILKKTKIENSKCNLIWRG